MHDSAWSPYGESRGVSGVNGPQHLHPRDEACRETVAHDASRRPDARGLRGRPGRAPRAGAGRSPHRPRRTHPSPRDDRVCQTHAYRRGFRALEVVTDTLRMRCADGSSFLRHSFIRLGFLPAWQSVVLPDAVERTFAVLERQRNTGAAERGELALTIPIACVKAQKPGAVAV
jgi:hypothetical protein